MVNRSGTQIPVFTEAKEPAVQVLPVVVFGVPLHACRITLDGRPIREDEGAEYFVLLTELVVHLDAEIVIILHRASQRRQVIVGETVREQGRRT